MLYKFTISSLCLVLIITQLIISSLFIFPQTVWAEVDQKAGLAIEPFLIEEQVVPGQIIKKSFRITNNADNTKTYYPIVKDIRDVSDGGIPIFSELTDEVSEFTLRSWVHVDNPNITLGAEQKGTVTIKISVPKNASPGAHLGELFMSLTPVLPEINGAGVGVGYEVGAIISLTVAGNVREEAQVREFIPEKWIYGEADIKLLLSVVNLGNTVVRPEGTVEIVNMFGSKMANLPILDAGGGIIPGGRRTFSTLWTYDGFAFGRYEALAAMSYGEGSQGKRTIIANTSFWILPLKPLLYILGTLFLIALIFYFIARLYVKKQLRGLADRRVVKHTRHVSHLTFILLVAILFSIIFLLGIFVMYA